MSWMILAEIAAKSVLIAGVALLLSIHLKQLTAAQRAAIAHFGLLALLLMPLQVLFGPQLAIPGPWTRTLTPAPTTVDIDPSGIVISNPSSVDTAALASQLDPNAAVLGLYAIIAAGFVALLLVGLVRLSSLQRHASVLVEVNWLSALAQAQHRMGFKQGAALLHSAGLASPVSWGVMRPTIMLNSTALNTPDKAEAIIAHELAHVARMDWINLLLGRLATALFWFNPLVWLLAWQAHELREEAADDVVLRGPVQSSDYASLLVDFARGETQNPIAAHGVSPNKNWLKQRLTRVLDPDVRRDPAAPAWIIACAALAVALAVSVGAVTPLAVAYPGAREEIASLDDLDDLTVTLDADADLAGGSDRAAADHDGLLAPEDLAELSLHGVTPEWLDTMEREIPSLRDEDADEIATLAALEVTPEWIRSMRQAGYGNLTVDQMTSLRALDVTPQYIRALAEVGYRDLDVGTLEDFAALEVTPDYIREMQQAGYPQLTPDQLVSLRAARVGAPFVRSMAQQGLNPGPRRNRSPRPPPNPPGGFAPESAPPNPPRPPGN